MVVHRFEALPNAKDEQYLLARCDHAEGLMGLVIEILKVEASLADNQPRSLVDFADVIKDELSKSRLPDATLFGTIKHFAEWMPLMRERPTL
jgi:hypothetical protein